MQPDSSASTIVVLPSQRRMLPRLVLLLLLVLGFTVAMVILWPGSPVRNDWRLVFIVAGMIVIAVLTFIQSSALIYRLAHPAPSIIV